MTHYDYLGVELSRNERIEIAEDFLCMQGWDYLESLVLDDSPVLWVPLNGYQGECVGFHFVEDIYSENLLRGTEIILSPFGAGLSDFNRLEVKWLIWSLETLLPVNLAVAYHRWSNVFHRWSNALEVSE